MSLTQVRLQPFFDMITYMDQCLAAVAIMKVTDPPSYGGVKFVHYPFKRHNRPRSLREFGYTVFELLQGFLRWLYMGIQIPGFPALSHPEGKPKKVELSLVGIDYFRLCLIQGKFKPL